MWQKKSIIVKFNGVHLMCENSASNTLREALKEQWRQSWIEV